MRNRQSLHFTKDGVYINGVKVERCERLVVTYEVDHSPIVEITAELDDVVINPDRGV